MRTSIRCALRAAHNRDNPPASSTRTWAMKCCATASHRGSYCDYGTIRSMSERPGIPNGARSAAYAATSSAKRYLNRRRANSAQQELAREEENLESDVEFLPRPCWRFQGWLTGSGL